MEFAGRPLVVETGKLAQLASGECMIRYGETAVHCVATISDKPREGVDFFPFRWIMKRSFTPWAESPAPSLRREGRPTEKAILSSALSTAPCDPSSPRT